MSGEPGAEEAWESEVAAALGGLPPVEPPAGFLDRALNHRPLHAGRVLAGLVLLSLGGLGLSLAVGAPTTGPVAAVVADDDATGAGADGDDDLGSQLRTALPGLEGPLLDEAADGVLALARQLGFP
ncbi:MAG: hypothetical protein AAFN30_17020 [Actinomycetota bacterium]